VSRGRPATLLRVYGPCGASARVSYSYSRLVGDGVWQLPAPAGLFDAGDSIREQIARQRDAPAGFAPDVLAIFEHEPELIDVAALHLLERHFAPGLHEEILEAVGLELGTPIPTRRRAAGFRAAVLEAYLAECCVCGFSLRVVDGLIGVDHIQWHSHGGPDEVPNGFAPSIIICWTTAPSRDLRVRVARSVAGKSARGLLEETDGQEIRLPVDRQFYPNPGHVRWHHAEVFKGRV